MLLKFKLLLAGCDTRLGFGQALARRLDSLGVRVFAGCLDKTSAGSRQLAEETSDKLTTVQVDITDDEQVYAAVKLIENSLTHDEG